MWHLFGNILTRHGTAANNRGENEGNITPLQKLWWKGETHTTVSAEAIRWALRYYWQQVGYQVNRRWNDSENKFSLENLDYDAARFIDDDVLGYMRAEGAKLENSDEVERDPTIKKAQSNANRRKTKSDSSAKKDKKVPKGTVTARRGALEVSRAVSTTAFMSDITFNAMSGEKGRTSLYSTEVHATRYQYGFAMTPDRLTDKSRTCAVLDGLASLGEVAGNHSRFLYDFSPESIILRWTHDFSPRFLYCFEENDTNTISISALIQQISAGDIDPKELWAGGWMASALEEWGANVFPGVKATVKALKQVIRQDLEV